MEAIQRRLELAASPEKVWKALTDGAELARWFPDQQAELDLLPGGDGVFVWQNHGRYAVRVQEVQPLRRLVWRWARKPGTPIEAGPSTRVEWTLFAADGGGTILRMRESGFQRPADREENAEGWDHELQELAALLEPGQEPDGAPDFASGQQSLQ